MEVYVCIGSSCHLKGSYDIINVFKQQIAQQQIEDKVNLNASFCLGHCQNGVTIKIDDRIVTGLNAENAAEVFQKEVVEGLKKS
ncbi:MULTISPECIES: (2Fe-2S) ferredoxin domain-containing protein [Anaerotruncus]|jgi:NADH:ubiquinone oxidoreductase subunit E|uniref:(2Fe-2S) ferredoxin domain-containing protein n=1 Tax=Anaerotruncus colihominis TaxID=169435 RepID=A0A845RKM6_9FIRM|nr:MULTISPECIES: (2Fe-2S) ferredoxin domain-containing protein [Anaerotruncus]MCI8492844.1 (2Fe-2S) ferredoxin domain-containing protein [Anaerotruncus sp.]MCR2024379.1 (2Fe-2S) ferredoxin domain-containing protein [Anaerotruncus colihominis]NBI79331.1 (2Fe-2S) ferredoxin domain-containing protein [Anaerotruncus colihominis]NDO39075.1 (2Fe-2S) ferredoxin domain-containing protein [Anaerotruncus colihominis]